MDIHIAQLSFFSFLILVAFTFGKITERFSLGESSGQIFGGFLAGPLMVELMDVITTRTNLPDWASQLTHSSETAGAMLSQGISGLVLFMPAYIVLISAAIMDEWQIDRLRDNFGKSIVYSIVQVVTTLLPITTACYYLFSMTLSSSIFCGLIALLGSPVIVYIGMNTHQVEGRLRTLWSQIQVFTTIFTFILAMIYFSFVTDVEFLGAFQVDRLPQLFLYPALAGFGAFFMITTLAKTGLFAAIDAKDKDAKFAELLAVDSVPTTAVLVLVSTIMAIIAGVLLSFNLPLFFAAFVAGFLLSNYHSQYIFDALKIPGLMDLFHLLFFALFGACVDMEMLQNPEVLMFSLVYILIRTAGKFGGIHLAAKFLKESREVKQALCWLFIPQGGIAVVALLTSQRFFTVSFEDDKLPLFPVFLLSEVIGAIVVTPVLTRYRAFVLKQKEEKTDQTVQVVKDIQRVSIDTLIADRVIVDINVHNSDDAIKMLTAELVKHGHVSELRNITALVVEREKLSSTAIGDEIALPHCRTADVDFPMVVAGFVAHGESIDWNAPDGHGVRYIFLLVTPLNDPNLHIEAMKTLTTNIMRPEFLKELEKSGRNKTTFEYLHALATGSYDDKKVAKKKKGKK